MAEADTRDAAADARDHVAAKRDMAANLQSWVEQRADGAGHDARTDAAKERSASRGDRAASKIDRTLLAEDDDPRE